MTKLNSLEKTESDESLNDKMSHHLTDQYSPKNKIVRVASEPILPVLPERYHGPGCAMEINILEKHYPTCR